MYRSTTRRFVFFLVLGAIAHLLPRGPQAAATLYGDPNGEALVRGGPNEVLLLPGADLAANDVVVYRLESLPTGSLTAPTSVPPTNTASTGVAAVVDGYANVPRGLVVQLPGVVTAEAYYSLWVRSAASGQWSAGLRINEPRPMWITPDLAYRNAQIAGLPRRLKVVGRNLHPRPGKSARVRLSGPKTYNLLADTLSTTLSPYVAQVTLPSNMTTGNYSIEVCRDAQNNTCNWVALAGQQLQVAADPATPPSFSVGNYGNGSDPCLANDGIDDTRCVQSAINAAVAAGGGDVLFGAGAWDLDGSHAAPAIDPQRGIVVPTGVGLKGTAVPKPRVRSAVAWAANIVFTLQGNNRVVGLQFEDLKTYTNANITQTWNPYFRFGALTSAALPGDPTSLQDIRIFNNTFVDSFMALGTGGFPLRRLYIANNTFSAFFHGFFIVPDWAVHDVKFRLDDSVIVDNLFLPSYYFDPSITQGSIATHIGSGYRLDFSNNISDGRDTTYIRTAPPGWRASFFWSAATENEMILASGNTGYCSGDRSGDGELFDYDQNVFVGVARAAADTALAPFTNSTVTIPGPLRVPSPTNYYVGFWAQVVDGRGLGQSRKVASYTTNPSNGDVTFALSSPWSVAPDASSKVVIARPYMRVFTVDNQSFNGLSSGCTMNNANVPRGGGLQVWGPMANSVFEGNVQHESDGVMFVNSFNPDPSLPTASVKYFVDVRSNTIDREYDWDDSCSWSGIHLFYGTRPDAIGVTQIYGVNVAQNTIDQADGLVNGGFQSTLSWYPPPAGSPPSAKNTIVQSNTIKNIQNPAAFTTTGCVVTASTRVGIALRDSHTSGTVFYNNVLTNNAAPMCEAVGTASVFVAAPICSGTCPTCP